MQCAVNIMELWTETISRINPDIDNDLEIKGNIKFINLFIKMTHFSN